MIIKFRNTENIRSIAEASEKHIIFLKDLTLQIRDENHASATVAVHTHKDAKAIKALTTTATAFLPASLIAVCPFCPKL
jgi:mannitol/fructose-specific phosphotransferase system IIA component